MAGDPEELPMSRIDVSREIAAPPQRVWELITDLRGAPARLTTVKRVEMLAGPEFGVGTRWRETRVMFGRDATEEMTVTAVDPGRSYTTEADSRGVRYVSELRVEPAGTGSRLSMSIEAEVGNPVLKVLLSVVGRLFAGTTRKAMRQDLDDIAATAERG
jgi:carbon monoxide dehydrogenase subunit G